MCIKDESGKVLFDIESVSKRWEEYVEQLFDDQRNPEKPEIRNLEGPKIIQSEVRQALKHLKGGKAPGPDEIYSEMIQAAGDLAVEKLTKLCNMIYDTGYIPEDLRRSIFITIPKKPKAMECKDHRTISLMSHVTKILLKVILARLEKRVESEIAEEQYGFRKGRGTREAIFNLRILCERSLEMNREVYLAFIDYEKAFDRVRHEDLLDILMQIGLDGKDVRVIRNLYWEQEASIQVSGEQTGWKHIKRGVRQGCVLSPTLFGLYSEIILRNIDDLVGVKVGGRNINNIRYADDTVLIAETEQDLQNIIGSVGRYSEEKGLRINIRKTKVMKVSKTANGRPLQIYINGDQIETVEKFAYLGSIITNDGRCENEIKRRIGIAKTTFMRMRDFLCNKNVSFTTRYRMAKCYVWSTLLYGAETWTISKGMRQRIDAVEMWIIRRMLKISYTKHTSNEEVLRMAGIRRQLFENIQSAQIRYFGHIARHTTLQQTILTGKINGKRGRGRPRQKWTDNIKRWSGTDNIFQRAQERAGWRDVAANPRREDGT